MNDNLVDVRFEVILQNFVRRPLPSFQRFPFTYAKLTELNRDRLVRFGWQTSV